ncbi:MAG: RimJ/RimL family protein N-acetyltransferase [Pseudohongiellaceae bacterium]
MIGLETKRLLLREVCLGDAEFILQLTNEPGWLRFIGDKNIASLEGAEAYIQESIIASYQKHGFGIWLVELRGTDGRQAVPMGTCGLIDRPTLKDVDLGFAFLASYAGYGYAFEAARAVIDYIKKTGELTRLLAITLPDNERSINLLSKLDFKNKGPIELPIAGGIGKETLLLFDQSL